MKLVVTLTLEADENPENLNLLHWLRTTLNDTCDEDNDIEWHMDVVYHDKGGDKD